LRAGADPAAELGRFLALGPELRVAAVILTTAVSATLDAISMPATIAA
jgi:uncharacterized membrane protein